MRRLITLTYRPPFCLDHGQVVEDVGVFIRKVRKGLGVEAFAYVWVPELHKDGRRYHVHVVVDRFVSKSLVEKSWGHGFVDVRMIRNQGQGKGTAMRRVAGYVAKYVAKTYEGGTGMGGGGRHRYECAQGFQPVSVELEAPRPAVFARLASEHFGGEPPSSAWSSASVEHWTGPPVEVFEWALA
jgi:hypothetical protein